MFGTSFFLSLEYNFYKLGLERFILISDWKLNWSAADVNINGNEECDEES